MGDLLEKETSVFNRNDLQLFAKNNGLIFRIKLTQHQQNITEVRHKPNLTFIYVYDSVSDQGSLLGILRNFPYIFSFYCNVF